MTHIDTIIVPNNDTNTVTAFINAPTLQPSEYTDELPSNATHISANSVSLSELEGLGVKTTSIVDINANGWDLPNSDSIASSNSLRTQADIIVNGYPLLQAGHVIECLLDCMLSYLEYEDGSGKRFNIKVLGSGKVLYIDLYQALRDATYLEEKRKYIGAMDIA